MSSLERLNENPQMNFVQSFIYEKVKGRPNLQKIINNLGWLAFDKILRISIGLIVGVWVARYLGPAKFGILSFAAAFVGLLAPIAGLGLQDVVVRNLVRNPQDKNEILGTAFILQIIAGILAYSLTLGIIFFIRPDDSLVYGLVAILGSTMLFKCSEVTVFWLESRVSSKYIIWTQNVCLIFFAIIKVTLILNHSSLIAFAWVTMVEALTVSLMFIWLLNSLGPKLRKLYPSLKLAKNLLADSWPQMMSGLAIMIYMRIDQIMLGEMVDEREVGIYSAALRISEAWYFIPMIVVASVFPSMIKTRIENKEKYFQRLQQLYEFMVWLSVGIAVPMTFLSTPIIVWIYGVSYSSAGAILAIHIWTAVFVFLGVASGKHFIVENRQMLLFKRTLLGAIVNIVLNLVLIPRFGSIGAAFSTIAANAAAAYFFDFFSKSTRDMFAMKSRALNLFRPFLK